MAAARKTENLLTLTSKFNLHFPNLLFLLSDITHNLPSLNTCLYTRLK
jgi:hypothetical protein